MWWRRGRAHQVRPLVGSPPRPTHVVHRTPPRIGRKSARSRRIRLTPQLDAVELDGFCADALPHVWAQDPRNRRIRAAVACLAWPGHDSTISALFATAAQCRGSLGNGFLRLERYALIVAELLAARQKLENRQQALGYDFLDGGTSLVGRLRNAIARRRRKAALANEQRRVEVRRRQATAAFVEGKLEDGDACVGQDVITTDEDAFTDAAPASPAKERARPSLPHACALRGFRRSQTPGTTMSARDGSSSGDKPFGAL